VIWDLRPSGEPFWQGADAAISIDAGQGCGGGGEDVASVTSVRVVDGGGAGVGISQFDEDQVVFVFEFDAAGAGDQADADFEQVVIADGAAVIHQEFGDDQEGTLGLHSGISEAAGAEEFGSGHFQPGGIGSVMGDTHGVALAIADAQGGGPGECRPPLGSGGK